MVESQVQQSRHFAVGFALSPRPTPGGEGQGEGDRVDENRSSIAGALCFVNQALSTRNQEPLNYSRPFASIHSRFRASRCTRDWLSCFAIHGSDRTIRRGASNAQTDLNPTKGHLCPLCRHSRKSEKWSRHSESCGIRFASVWVETFHSPVGPRLT